MLLMHPLLGPYDYAVPAGESYAPGDIVSVPLGRQTVTGVVWDVDVWPDLPTVSPEKLRAIISRVALPPLSLALRQFIIWVSRYYLSPPGAVLRMALSMAGVAGEAAMVTMYRMSRVVPEKLSPQGKKALEHLFMSSPLPQGERGSSIADLAKFSGVSQAIIRGLIKQGALQPISVAADTAPPCPNPDHMQVQLESAQAHATTDLINHVATQSYKAVLLDGITGSGKTEVYFEAIAAVLKSGGQSLVLLPEIAMTRQWFLRFEARFGVAPVEWHSDLSPKQRRANWRAIINGTARVIVGARSALFLPYADLKLIIVDEEHEASFKQEDSVPYHARDMAVVRARYENCLVVLASATPSLESRENAKRGRYAWLKLDSRYGKAQLPEINLIDLKRTPPPARRWLSEPLLNDLTATIARGEQALLFLNRRGYAPLTLCRTCGERVSCPQCAAWLVEHRLTGRLHCHHCGFATPIPKRCRACEAENSLVACGPGVERIAEEVMLLLPEVRMRLVTSDTINSPAKASELIAAVESGAVQLLVGTQLATKGHHFPGLTCVGIVDADLGLAGGDLRAAERTFQQITQASGRAGRADKPGRVWLQSWQPEHPVMQALKSGDTDAFYEAEAESRARYNAPPFGRYVALIVSGKDQNAVADVAKALGRASPVGATVLGPAPAPLALLRGRHRMRLLMQVERGVAVQPLVRRWLAGIKVVGHVRIAVDVDPYGFM